MYLKTLINRPALEISVGRNDEGERTFYFEFRKPGYVPCLIGEKDLTEALLNWHEYLKAML